MAFPAADEGVQRDRRDYQFRYENRVDIGNNHRSYVERSVSGHGMWWSSVRDSADHARQRSQSHIRWAVPPMTVTPIDDQTCSGQSAGSCSIPENGLDL